jgi:hypothetical protein
MGVIRDLALSTVVVASGAAGHAQQPTRVLDKPQVELSDPFTNVGSVRELSDGRVIVIDNGDRAVYVADFKAGTSSQVGRPGGGPGEYRLPGLLLPLAGDTTLVTDGGNRRLLVLGPDAKPAAIFTDTWPLPQGEPGTRMPRGIDGQGRAYYLGRAVGVAPSGQITQPDSAALMRSARGSSAEELVSYIHLAPRKISTTSKGGTLTSVNITMAPFSAQDAWQVFPDGAVAIARVADYRVDWFLPDGRHVAGKPIAFTPVRVTDRDKAERSTRQPTGGAAATPPVEWPEVKPPFAYQGVLAGTDGRVWLQRYTDAADTRTQYDVIDRRGVVVARVAVPNGGRIVGFGPRSIYVVRKDADDLQYLQRFPL